MGTITGLTAERMLEIEAASVVDGDIVGDNLFLTRKDGTPLNAGNVRGPRGADGPMGAALSVLSDISVLEVGIANQIRAGRVLTPGDFTSMGLLAPIALWNLTNLADSSGNGRNLTNKGAVQNALGIAGLPGGAFQFIGSTGQALYIPDAGTADPFRVKTITVGAWVRTAKRGVAQWAISKWDDNVAGRRAWMVGVNTTNVAQLSISTDGGVASVASAVGTSDIADDKWHFIVGTFDGHKVKIYVDGVLEGQINLGTSGGTIFGTPAALNIGGYNADAALVTTAPFFGRVDEAFVTSEVLSLEQIRNLTAASVPHALGVLPTDIRLAVRRRRRGAAMVAGNFPAQPVRLYNFTGGALTDLGSNNVPLTWSGVAQQLVAGADGSRDGAYYLTSGQQLMSSDAGLPSALQARSYGLWVKTLNQNTAIMGWGTYNTAHTLIYTANTAGGPLGVASGADNMTGPAIADGLWHHIVVVEDNAAVDGVKRKLYLDGKCVGGSTVMNPITLAGAGRFRIGEVQTGGPLIPYVGEIDGVFVYAGSLNGDQIRSLYNVGSQALVPKIRDSSEFIEGTELGRLLGIFNAIEGSDTIDIQVMA